MKQVYTVMMRGGPLRPARGLWLVLSLAIPAAILSAQGAAPAAPTTNIPFTDAAPIFQVLREDLWPADLRTQTPAQIEAGWPDWVARRDAAIRARVLEGDEDSIINLLLFGTTFTTQPRVTENQLAGLLVRQAGTGATAFVPSPLLRARIADFEAALQSPGGNERVPFARQVIERRGLSLATEAGKAAVRQYLEQRTSIVGSAVHAAALLNPATPLVDQVTLFKDRGLASDTAILIDYAVERALAGLKEEQLLRTGTVRRVAIVGPGLDFADKQEGYDFYPQQTIQPFALVDSLVRLGLAASDLQLTAFDLSPRVLQHLETARERAAGGASYSLVLPRKLDQSWLPDVLKYWERFGDRIGATAKVAPPPSSAGPVTARRVLVPPSVTLSLRPRDVNIVVQRVEPANADDQFDLVLATNILLYYDVFEQSLAVTNVASMLRPGGLFLTNDRIFELPDGPVRAVGATNVPYMKQPGAADKGDELTWYQRPSSTSR